MCVWVLARFHIRFTCLYAIDLHCFIYDFAERLINNHNNNGNNWSNMYLICIYHIKRRNQIFGRNSYITALGELHATPEVGAR